MTDYAIKLFMDKLVKLSDNDEDKAIKIIQQSIEESLPRFHQANGSLPPPKGGEGCTIAPAWRSPSLTHTEYTGYETPRGSYMRAR